MQGKHHLLFLYSSFKMMFGCVVASAFEATTVTHPFGNAPTTDFYWWGLPLIVARPQVCKKQQLSLKTHEQWSTVHGFLP
jgi:hypothetical protein